MTSQDKEPGAATFTEDLLEAYALGHLSGARLDEVKHHVEQREQAAAQLARVQENIARIGTMLQTTHARPDAPLDEFLLAAYLDDALGTEEHAQLEECLARSPRQLARLVALYRETKAVLDPAAHVRMVDNLSAAQILPLEEHRINTAARAAHQAGDSAPGAAPQNDAENTPIKREMDASQ